MHVFHSTKLFPNVVSCLAKQPIEAS